MGISQKLFNLIPNYSVKNKTTLTTIYKMGDYMGRPMQNRLIMGATALLTQPFIDEHNKRVDKDTARASRNRTIGKIVAGATVGCIVRGGVYNLIDKCTSSDIKIDKWENLLTPRVANAIKNKNYMRNYKTALATIIAMFVMLGTNILFDVPLTNMISNFLNKRDAKKKQKEAEALLQAQTQAQTQPSNSLIEARVKFHDTFKTWKEVRK